MIIDEEMNAYEIAQAIYNRQLDEGGGYIDTYKYYWKLGERVHKNISSIPLIYEKGSQTTYPTLFGIQVRFDAINPGNIQLFKDVTM